MLQAADATNSLTKLLDTEVLWTGSSFCAGNGRLKVPEPTASSPSTQFGDSIG